MQTTNTVHITVRTFTGNSFHIDVDPTRTVGELKPMIVAAGKENSIKVVELEYKGHELRDSRRFDHYGLATNDVVDVVLPSQVPKISLALVREDGSGFDITVSSGITVAKLKEEIKFKEKITVRQLKLVNNQGDEDGDGVVTLLEMQDGKSISYYSLEGQKILVNVSVGVAVSTSSAIGILVLVDNRIEDVEGSCIGVAVRLDQTLDSFKELLLNTHCFHCAEHSLILNGLELKDDEQTLGDLGFVEGCTVDAVAAVQLSVATIAGKNYKFALKATTLISEIRKLLRNVDADVGDQDDYAFSLDGVHTIRESRTLWDLHIYSGTIFILKNRHLVALSIQYFGLPANHHECLGTKLDDEISIDDSASLDDLGAEILGMVPFSAEGMFQPRNQVHVSHRHKPLGGTRTIKEERLEGGDVVDITLMPLKQRIPREVKERGQMGSDIPLAAHLSQLGDGYYARFERLGDLADLENAITMDQQALALTPDGHPSKPLRLSNLGTRYSDRFENLYDLTDLENAIEMQQQGVALTPDGHPDKPTRLSNIGTTYYDRFDRLGGLEDLENAIKMQQQALALTSDGHPDKPMFFANLGTCYSDRFNRLGDLDDLENGIKMQQQGVTLTPDDHPSKPTRASNLSTSYSARFGRLGDLADLEKAIMMREEAIALTPDGHPDKPVLFSNLGTTYSARFRRLGDLDDLENVITMQQKALALTPDGHPSKPIRLSNLSASYTARFGRLGDLTDLEKVITMRKEAIVLTSDGHPDKPVLLSNLATCYSDRFDRLGDLNDLQNVVIMQQQALTITPDGHPSKPTRLSNIGTTYYDRYDRLGDLEDLENAIKMQEQALALTPKGHPSKPTHLSNIGTTYSVRFERLGDLDDLEIAITMQQQALALTPDDHPSKPTRLSNLGASYSARFRRLGDLVDLDKAIKMQQQGVALTPDGHPDKPTRLSNLGTSYSARFGRLGDLADLENVIDMQQQALARTPDGHPSKPTHLSNIGTTYSVRFGRLGDLGDLENAITMQQQALALTPDSHPDKPSYLSLLGTSYSARFARLGNLDDMEKAITRDQQALALTPDGHPSKPNHLSNLGTHYSNRFGRLGDLADLENAITMQQQALTLTPDGHPSKPARLSNIGTTYSDRFDRLGDLDDIQNAITMQQQALALTPDGHPDKPTRLSNLGTHYSARLGRLGDLADLEKAITMRQQALALTPDGHPSKPTHFSNLGASYSARFEWLGDLADLENAIMTRQQAITLTPDSHPNRLCFLSNLGTTYRARFLQLGDIADLEDAIRTAQEALTLTPDGHPEKPDMLLQLGAGYHMRFRRLADLADYGNGITAMKLAAQSLGGSPSRLLRISRAWAAISLSSGDISSALEALRTALELLPEVAWLGLDIPARQGWLAKEQPEELGCMAATCAIRLGRFEEAVELVDMARSVFWQQASSVRSGLQDLKAEHPELAGELMRVSRQLDTSSFSGLSTSDDTKLYERRLADHRGLVLKRESLIKEIRSLPGFEFSLKPTPFNQLREAAGAGRVVIINISKLGTDALVFDRTNPIRHVPLSQSDAVKSFKHTDEIELQQTRADRTQDQERSLTLPEVLDRIDVDFDALKQSRETNLTTSDDVLQRQARADVTEDWRTSFARLPRVWEHILKPIFAESGLGIPLQRTKYQVPANRIFWYLTGPLTVIPIHAAGPVSQLVVSSYVTTLSSLAEAQKRQSEAIGGPPMLLAISQPDTPNQSRIPHATDEVDMVTQTVLAAGWPESQLQRFDRTQATVDGVSTALNTCSWVHFACHAMQDPRDGMQSAFALEDGRLKLSVIAAKRLTLARFAFLSTCQSAAGLEDSRGEAIHLSAGMQFAGFSSVIATMWSIRDEDAPVIAKHTYEYLLRNGLDEVDLTEAAAALNYAVSRLRADPTVTMERWAPFVYYGV